VRVATTVSGSGFPERTDPAALVVGPAGVRLEENGILYVADGLGNRVAKAARRAKAKPRRDPLAWVTARCFRVLTYTVAHAQPSPGSTG